MEFEAPFEAVEFAVPEAPELDARVQSARPTPGLGWQATLARSVCVSGTGLHSGQPVTMHLHPAAEDTGVWFLRSDLQNGARHIQARAHNVTDTQLCTLLSNGKGGSVSTVEHLMAALHALGVHNVIVEIDGPELPIFDGSSAAFVAAIEQAGLERCTTRARALVVRETVTVRSADAWASLRAGDARGLNLDVSIDFDAACIGHQSAQLALSPASFTEAVAHARTFGFREELEAMQAQGRALGGGHHSAIVISNQSVENPEGLRSADEFARHKLLDAVGDLYIEGLPVLGTFASHKSGHRLVNQLMRSLIERPKSFEIVEI